MNGIAFQLSYGPRLVYTPLPLRDTGAHCGNGAWRGSAGSIFFLTACAVSPHPHNPLAKGGTHERKRHS